MADVTLQRDDAGTAGSARDVELVERSPTARELLAWTWRERQVIGWLGLRMIVRTYAATRLGMPWLFLRFLIPTLGMALVFGGILGVPSNGVPYLLFLFVGMAAWQSFDRVVFWSTRSLDRLGKFWSNFHLPMLAIPIGACGLVVLEIVTFALVSSCLIAYHAIVDDVLYLHLSPALLLGVAGIALAATFGLSLGLLLALLNAKARDTFIVLRYVLQVWMFITPVLYPLRQLPGVLETLARVNPVTPMVELAKYGFIDAASPDPLGVAYAVGVTAVVAVAGLYLFARRSPWIWRDNLMFEDDEDEELFTR